MLNRSLRPLALAVAAATLLQACATAPGNYLDTSRLDDKDSQSAEHYNVQLITAQLVVSQADAQRKAGPLPPARFVDPMQYVYRIAPQDILGVTVWDHPELTTPQGQSFSSGGNTTQTVAGALQQPYANALPGQADPYGQTVMSDGTIYFPFVGRLHAAGKTVGQVRDELAARLARYVKNPQVDVRVLSYRSQKVQVTGEVKTPGPLAITDVPLTLVDAITRSGGSTNEADLQRVRLTRDGKFYQLDANGMLDRGDVKQNVMLQPGDIVNVPDRGDSRVFVMGEVKTPATVPMLKGRLTIADALTAGGGILDTDANPRQVYVLRDLQDKPNTPDIFRLDMTQPDALMLSSRFQLKPLDVVYVGTAGSVRFNRLLQQIFPTIQSIYYMKQITR
ncbi:capsular polysaccharide biosynthesis/export periplasmic protein [Burkholderia pseudomallei]|uniref:polysaccharide biosynthesis/export family protein n=1 Tax=Burkholderia pseudomallei TaxID=28450 RepID=UPI000055B967|nr:polysaccharide biosynthesis/export family protein [Burkholderia pseudomallei]EDS83052.1 capsular polysaccharide biosynthesis/export protein [Burkholderia pseudomallei S13]CAJ9595914.1 capsular polysaccharide biosynthesis/export periplasmic protein [Burkholderia pseudomallei]CAJ9711649.1 capsular polysaccharide biosynthesis/export periplasmic protein [Burkholderia pseudomallei]CAJ9793320.1 capsular polysaccharide biosynthesis/export periplasmic protein [Burkholderia pseudomallei]CFL53005.1 c